MRMKSESRSPKAERGPRSEGRRRTMPTPLCDFKTRSSAFLRLSGFAMIRVVLPYHLRTLARVEDEVQVEVAGAVTVRAVLDALEVKYPMLRGTIRDHGTLKRRPFVRFFACKEDLSLDPPETPLPGEVVTGVEPLLIVGAMAGG